MTKVVRVVNVKVPAADVRRGDVERSHCAGQSEPEYLATVTVLVADTNYTHTTVTCRLTLAAIISNKIYISDNTTNGRDEDTERINKNHCMKYNSYQQLTVCPLSLLLRIWREKLTHLK